nr:MAG TPA: hypothetical protein [Caudoviricetes sp.]
MLIDFGVSLYINYKRKKRKKQIKEQPNNPKAYFERRCRNG